MIGRGIGQQVRWLATAWRGPIHDPAGHLIFLLHHVEDVIAAHPESG